MSKFKCKECRHLFENKFSNRSMEVKLPAPLGNGDGQTDRPTVTDGQTGS